MNEHFTWQELDSTGYTFTDNLGLRNSMHLNAEAANFFNLYFTDDLFKMIMCIKFQNKPWQSIQVHGATLKQRTTVHT